MTGWIPLTIAIILHVWIAAGFAVKKDWPMVVVFIGYSIASLGMILHYSKT